jgi:hypothetical protein
MGERKLRFDQPDDLNVGPFHVVVDVVIPRPSNGSKPGEPDARRLELILKPSKPVSVDETAKISGP